MEGADSVCTALLADRCGMPWRIQSMKSNSRHSHIWGAEGMGQQGRGWGEGGCTEMRMAGSSCMLTQPAWQAISARPSVVQPAASGPLLWQARQQL